MTRNASLLALPLFAIILISCSKDDEAKQPAAPITTLQVNITDNSGSPVTGVAVALYRNLSDWEREQNPVQTAISTSNGRALFSYLTDTAYFVTALKGNLSNWESTTYLHGLQSGSANQAQLLLESSKSNMLSSVAGKTWRLVVYKENELDMSAAPQAACIMDNTWRFYKGSRTGKFVHYEDSVSCVSGAPDVLNGTWQLVNNGQQLRLAPDQQQTQNFVLEYLSETTLRINRQAAGITYAYVWQSN